MKARIFLVATAAVFGLAAAAAADTPAADKSAAPCFFSSSWEGWRSPDANTIYLRIGIKEIYKVDLSAGSPLLLYPDATLVSRFHGTDTVCSPLDLDIIVHEGGQSDPIIAKSITKLTAEQVAAIPKKYLP